MYVKLRLVALLAACFLILITGTVAAENYASPKEIVQQFKSLAENNKSISELHQLTKTPGDRELVMLELSTNSNNPAIIVVANMEGNAPLASVAALRLAELLTTDWKDQLNDKTWFIIPVGNPDGFAHFFDTPLAENFLNGRMTNADKDDATDEDSPDDLNGDRLITIMRQLHPEGKWLPVESNPLLMRKADSKKGEVGLYRIFDEGIDNDSDGAINEDGLGGVNPGRNFPHRFEHYTTNGTWAASEVESRAILTFCFDHPEIAMALTFGHSNTLTEPPPNDRRGESGGGPYKLPRWWSGQIGVDKDKKFPIAEIVEMAKDFFGDPDIDEDRVLRFLDGGAAVNPHKSDFPYLEKISDEFGEFLETIELEEKRLKSAPLTSGCFEEWAYYQFGVPSFSYDFWTLPEPKEEKDEDAEADSTKLTTDQIKEMSTDDFIALGEEKISEFLEQSGAPEQFNAERLIKGLESGRMNTKRLVKMIEQFGKDDDDDKGGDETEEALFAFSPESILPWQSYDHPEFGKVEIGGTKPWATLAPPYELGLELVNKQLPFIKTLANKLPRLTIDQIKITRVANSVYKLEVWVANEGFLPFPMAHGKRTLRPIPAVLTCDSKGLKFLEGKRREPLSPVGGSTSNKTEWLVSAPEGQKIVLILTSSSAGSQTKEITLKGGQN